MRRLDCEQRSPEWFAARCGIATASHFGDVMAKGKGNAEAITRRNYRVRLAIERITGQPTPDGFQTQAMLDGIERESLALSMYQTRTGSLVDPVGILLHDTLECGASPDGLVDDDGMVEAKCPTDGVFATYLRLEREPAEYTAQIQGQLWIANRKWCDFISFNPNFPLNARFICRRVYRDEQLIEQMANEVRVFMDDVRAEEAFVRSYQEAA